MKYGIYIHIPFCRNICNYCDFAINKYDGTMELYVESLCKEIDLFFLNNERGKETISTINFGGGTPTLLTPTLLEKIIKKLDGYFDLHNVEEFSVESNPGTFDRSKMIDYLSLGVNRVSIGVQTFTKSELGTIKRDHSPKKAETTIRNAIDLGFTFVNLDLMFSLPGQTKETWEYTLNRAAELGTNHISTYSLTYEEATPLYKLWKTGKIIKQSDEFDAEIYEFTIEKLKSLGFNQYEVSNFSKQGKECKHNLDNWHCNEYFAFGTGSHGFIDNLRYWNYKNLNDYYNCLSNNKLPREGERINSELELIKENIFLPIRADGIYFDEFKKNTNFDLMKLLSNYVNLLSEQGLIKIMKNKIQLSSKGYALCDSISVNMLKELENHLRLESPDLFIIK